MDEDALFFDTKWAHLPKRNFFQKNLLINFVPIIYAYQHPKNQSQISIY